MEVGIIMSNENYDNFVFYGSFRNTIEALPEDLGNKLIRAIMNYGTDGELDSSDTIIYAIMLSIIPTIDAAKDRFVKAKINGVKGGRPKKVEKEKVLELREQGLTQSEIAVQLDCHINTIKNILHNNKVQKGTKRYNNLDIDTDIDTDIDKDIDIENDTDTNIEKEKENDTPSFQSDCVYGDSEMPF